MKKKEANVKKKNEKEEGNTSNWERKNVTATKEIKLYCWLSWGNFIAHKRTYIHTHIDICLAQFLLFSVLFQFWVARWR